ncbi:flagellar assembly protein FliX [Emcibacter nanhaiensis]|uniref:Flagellar assembly protein FliX n=1 Tax=Emcibacter nanhaiensis TaxID=1505037 RepID=A0A501PRG0_9PROT|nr:flagellar assembly protein FliX [Emcibacter nanhaiensis]TPD62835.1 flagellar assembly protein FliX [Emcibacter nanhaiensis]
MEIKGPGKISTPGVSPKKRKKGVDKGAFDKALGTEETTSSSGVSGTAPLTAVNSLLALQEAETATEGRSRGLMRAEDLVEHLEAIQNGLLLGYIPQQKLQEISTIVSKKRDQFDDPALNDLLDDIELRVKVELAKLGR